MSWPTEQFRPCLSGRDIAVLIEKRKCAAVESGQDEEAARLAAVASVEADVREIRLLRELASAKPAPDEAGEA